jgi:eukaryotic-like serine/threonine-protein kinase
MNRNETWQASATMSTLDTANLAQLAVKLGLVNDAQLQEVFDQIGKNAEPQKLLFALERKGFLTPYQTSKLLKGDTDGYFLGGYRMLYKIASGSFGRVYRADDPRSGRVVAVKVLRRRWSEDQQKIDLFNREGKVGMTLQHPNIVEILNVGQDPVSGAYFIVMEFVEGGNLREILASCKKMEPPKALKLIEDAVAGLSHAFAKGLTHRDIKLTNILVSSQGVAKLVDFGLARICSDEEEQVDRTVDYAGLEKLTGVKMGDVRSDIYFLGCVLYEMLAGRSPLEMTRDRHARMNPRRFTEVQPLTRQDVEGPPQLFQLVETMMSLEPTRRYQTPSQLLDVVRTVRAEVEGGGTKPSGPPVVYVVEASVKLQEAMRSKFKQMGFRVLMAIDPARALDRFRQQPYQGLVIDVGSVGEDGLVMFERILAESEKLGAKLGAVLILGQDQADWQLRVRQRPNVAVMIMPAKNFHRRLRELMGITDASSDGE